MGVPDADVDMAEIKPPDVDMTLAEATEESFTEESLTLYEESVNLLNLISFVLLFDQIRDSLQSPPGLLIDAWTNCCCCRR